MERISNKFLVYLLLSCWGTIVWGTIQGQDFPKTPDGFVNDYARLLTTPEKNNLETFLRSVSDSTSNQISVALFTDLDGYSIEEFSHTVASTWGIGQRESDNGVLISVFLKERQMRIEVGYGLEGALTDYTSNKIIRNILQPHFRNHEFYEGLLLASQTIAQIAKGEFDQVVLEDRHSQNKENGIIIIKVIGLLFLILFLIVFLANILGEEGNDYGGYSGSGSYSSYSSGGWSSSSSGSSGGFGGGSFGGGGASGSW